MNVEAAQLCVVVGGATRPSRSDEPDSPSYWKVCRDEGVGGLISGASSGASMLPFTLASGPLTPGTAAMVIGGGALVGGVTGCAAGMWQKYASEH